MAKNFDLFRSSDEEFLIKFKKYINQSLLDLDTWRQVEVGENYALYEGDQWPQAELQRQLDNSMPALTINRTSPVLRSIFGFEINNRLEINYLSRTIMNREQTFDDVLNGVGSYIRQNARSEYQESIAFQDMIKCGVGCVDSYLSYDSNPDGEFKSQRIFPAFMLWDSTARAKNLLDADWICKIKILPKEKLAEEYGLESFEVTFDNEVDGRLLQFFQSQQAIMDLGVVYEFQWRQKETFYRIKNIFPLSNNADFVTQENAVQLASTIYNYYGIDILNGDPITVEKAKDADIILSLFNALGFESKKISHKQFKYYRAITTSGKMIKRSENYSNKGFSISFMTGEYSETEQMYFGLGRLCKAPQRLLNQAISDYVGFLQTIPKGGVNIEADAVNDIQAFVNTYTKARQVTIFEPNALSSGKVQPKIAPPIPQGMIEMVQYADSQIMQVCGVTPELMGIMESKEMNTSFYKQQVKQALTTLAPYFDAKKFYLQKAGELLIDAVFVLYENNPNIINNNVLSAEKITPEMAANYELRGEYDVIISDAPDNEDNNHEVFLKLLELQQTSPDKPIMPIALQYSNFNEDLKKQLTQLFVPQPTPPNPFDEALLQSEINYKNASAEKMKANAYRDQIEAKLKEIELLTKQLKEETEIEYEQAKTDNELSKTYKNLN